MPMEKVVDFGSIGEKLVGMLGAARDAFNRHGKTGLDQFKNLQTALISELDAAVKKLNGYIVQATPAEKAKYTAWQNLLVRLRQLVETMADLYDPIQKKMKDGVLFSEKAVEQTNGLFDSQAGLLRSILDIIQTDNAYLKKFVREEGLKIQQNSADYATEHESRLIEGLCTPKAAPIFLAILETFRKMGQQEAQMMP
jgi:Na+/phosphate symporter